MASKLSSQYTGQAVATQPVPKAMATGQGRKAIPKSAFDAEMTTAGMAVASYHFERGERTFAAFARAVVADLGDSVRPHVAAWYEAIRRYPGIEHANAMTPTAEVDASNAAGLPELNDTVPKSETSRLAQGSRMSNATEYDINWLIAEGRRHWKRYLPKLYRKLRQTGALERCLREAAERTRALMNQLEIAGLTSLEAWMEARSERLILDPRHYNQPEEQ